MSSVLSRVMQKVLGVWSMRQSEHDLLAHLPELSDEEKNQRTLAGLADVDAGRTISHEEVMSWAQSLLASGRRPNGGK